jgi:hypothetical protein
MITNVTELLAHFDMETFAEFARYAEYDSRLARFSFGLHILGEDVFAPHSFADAGAACTMIISSGCDETDRLNREHRLSFPFSMGMIDGYVDSVLHDNLETILLDRFGACTETGLTILREWLNDDIISALVEGVDIECLPHTVDECHYAPEYSDDQWRSLWTGTGIMIDSSGVYGVFSTWDECDWENSYESLLEETSSFEYKKSCEELMIPFDYTEYIAWLSAQRNPEDPLDYFVVPRALVVDVFFTSPKGRGAFPLIRW